MAAWAGDETPASGAAPGAGGIITAFADLDTEVSAQTVETATAEDELNLPASLTATAAGSEGRETTVTAAVYGWASDPDYDSDTAGVYTFAPSLDLPDGLTLAEGVSAPTITVTVEEAAAPLLRGLAGLLGAGATSYDYEIDLANINPSAVAAIDGYTVGNSGAGPLLWLNQESTSYHVYGTTDFYGLYISAAGISLTLEDASIAMTGWDAAIDLHSDLDLTLAGANSLSGQYVGISGGGLYDLTIGGTGSVSTTVSSGTVAAGIKAFTLNGGTVNARIAADTITINGGAVNAAATGWDVDALVAGSGVTITGGTLDVSTENGYGIDAGSGSIAITGGSVNASGGFEATDPQPTDGGTTLYKTTLGGLPADTEITGLTAPSGYGFADMKTDAEGWLYLWLPAGDQIVAFTAGTVNVDKTFTIAAGNNNLFAAVDVTANVNDAATLKAALENPVPSTVNVTTDIRLDSQITMGASHTLTIPGGKTVTASGSGRIGLEAYTLTINGGGTLVSQRNGGNALYSDSGTLNLASIAVELKNTSSGGISVKTVDVGSGATIVLDSGHARDLISLPSGYTCTVNTGGKIEIQAFWDDGLNMEDGTLHIDGGAVTVGAGQAGNRGIYAGSGGTLKYTSGTLNGTAGGMILLAEGAKAEGLNGKFRDRGTEFAATGQITVGATDAAASADGLTRGWYYWNGSQFVKEAIAIQTQPQDTTVTQSAISGSLTVSAAASNSEAVSYQWWEMNEGGWSSSAVVGAISSTFTIPTDLTEGTYYYYCVLSADGCEDVDSATAVITVNPPDGSSIYTVTFNANGGSVTPASAVTNTDGKLASLPTPTRSGSYRFDGWFTAASGGTQITPSYIFTADTTVYAHWTYTGGGSSSSGGGTATPKYEAEVSGGDSSVKTEVKVDTKAGSASAELSSEQMKNGGNSVVTIPKISGVTDYALGIPVPDLSEAGGSGSVTLNTEAGSLTLPSHMLSGTDAASGSKSQVTIGTVKTSELPEAAKAAVGNRPVVSLSLSIDGETVAWNNPDAPVTVSIPYTPTEEELKNPEGITVYYIDGSGELIQVPGARYDAKSGTVVFQTTHFSYYAVGYEAPVTSGKFTDVLPGAWYYDAVTFIAEKGITTGTGDDKFSPDAILTRGQFITLLMRAYGISPDVNPNDNFADAGNTYYTGYLAAAKRLGISQGIGANRFAPEQAITRQDMFTLLYNSLNSIRQLPAGNSGRTLSDFTDSDSIPAYAQEAMAYLVKTGTISGSGGKLDPTATTTRAQMAQVLYSLLGK